MRPGSGMSCFLAATASDLDVEASVQRIRFSHEPEARSIILTNGGTGTLVLTAAASSHVACTTTFTGATLAPGALATFEIRYRGAAGAANDAGVVTFPSNDLDENPLPIQVFGATRSLDPGAIAVDFTLPSFRWDADSSSFVPGELSLAIETIYRLLSFVRGDANDDGRIDLSDAIAVLLQLFGGAAPRRPDAADTNGDGARTIAGAVYLQAYLFDGGPPPP